MERGPGAERGGRSGAPGESRADGVDAGADAARESDARLAGDVGVRAAGAPARRLVDDGARLGGRGVAGRGASAAGARRGAPARLAAQIAELEAAQQAAVVAAAPTSAVRQLVQLKGVATTSASVLLDGRLGVARVPQSAPDRRDPGVCADALRQRRVDARAGDQSSRQCAAPGREHSARLELGALATDERADPVVSGELWQRQTRAADWHRRGGTEARDRAVTERTETHGDSLRASPTEFSSVSPW